MNEEEKTQANEGLSQDTKEDPKEDNGDRLSPVEKAEQVVAQLKAENERAEKLRATAVIGGKTEYVQAEKKEVSDAEFTKKVEQESPDLEIFD